MTPMPSASEHGDAGCSASVQWWALFVRRKLRTPATADVGHVWTAPLRQVLSWHAAIAVGCSHVSGLLVQPFFTTAGPDVVREVGPDQFHGLDTRDPKKVFPPRRPTDQHHAISTSATRDAL